MKKFLIYFTLLLGIFNTHIVFATEEPTNVTFIYINGSNNLAYNNRLKFVSIKFVLVVNL